MPMMASSRILTASLCAGPAFHIASLYRKADLHRIDHQLRVPAMNAVVGSKSQPLLPAAVHKNFWGLTLGSVGVVYGDIGTSPLYALKESLVAASGGGGLAPEMIFGVLSLIIWALIAIVTLKYVLIVLRADNNGEGGTLTLMALAQ